MIYVFIDCIFQDFISYFPMHFSCNILTSRVSPHSISNTAKINIIIFLRNIFVWKIAYQYLKSVIVWAKL